MYGHGLKKDGVVFEERENFDKLNEELSSDSPDDIPDILVLDNQYPNDEGVLTAIKAQRRAREVGRDIIVTILTAFPPHVIGKYGDELKKKGIPVLNKVTDGATLGFYLGACIGDNGIKNIGLNEWLIAEGMTMRNEYLWPAVETKEITAGMERTIARAEAGGLFMKPRTFIEAHYQRITRYMRPGSILELNLLIPPQRPGGERK